MKRIIILVFSISFTVSSWCQLISYNLSAIPDSIKKNAEVIVQSESKVFTLQYIEEATLNVRKIYTVVNEDGKDALTFYVATSKFISLTDAEMKVYDANGRQLSRHKKKDMMTQAMGEGLVDDGYVTFYSVNTSNYPVTIELEYELKFKGTLFYPPYDILVPGRGVMQSSFVAKVPTFLDLRY
ncbi:MAG TPA: DUF3857 domain-containing protein, partial [Chitinophagaceae bacterium]|nr:DUF3857 domain-containing protein [Chitinophagaceae bacterium]